MTAQLLTESFPSTGSTAINIPKPGNSHTFEVISRTGIQGPLRHIASRSVILLQGGKVNQTGTGIKVVP
jgi:hypothetical protein